MHAQHAQRAAHRRQLLRRAQLLQARHREQLLDGQGRLELPAQADVEALQRVLREAEVEAREARAAPQAERAQVLQVADGEGQLPQVGVALDAKLAELARRDRGAVRAAADARDVPQREHLHSTLGTRHA